MGCSFAAHCGLLVGGSLGAYWGRVLGAHGLLVRGSLWATRWRHVVSPPSRLNQSVGTRHLLELLGIEARPPQRVDGIVERLQLGRRECALAKLGARATILLELGRAEAHLRG